MKKLPILLGSLLVAAIPVQAETALIGCLYGSSIGNKSGIYKISTTTPTLTMLNDNPQATGGGVLAGNTYYCQWYLSMFGSDIWSNMAFNTETWEMQGAVGARDTWAFDLAYDEATDRIYGCFHDPDENYEGRRLVFGWIKPADYITDYATVTPVCDLFVNFAGMDFDSNGQLWAISREGLLLKVDKETGEMTQVAETGLVSDYNTTAAIDRSTDTMYYFLQLKAGSGATADQTSLYRISLPGGTATKVYDLPGAEAVQGMSIFVPLAEDKAPATPTALGHAFVDASLSGTVSFTVPSTTYDGQTASGSVSYKVSCRPYDDEEAAYTLLAEGTSSYGATENVEVTLPGNGWYSFAVVLGNTVGESPRALTDTYVGYDTPLSPSDVTATLTDDGIALTWTAPTKTLHNGYLDAAAMTYNIVRMPDEVTVAENVAATYFTAEIPVVAERTHYSYKVAAANHGMVSAASQSNSIALGNYLIPYFCGFETAEEFGEFTVLTKEARPDFYYHWEYHTGYKAAKLSNTTQNDDDWLITPALQLVAGHTYELTLVVGNNDNNDPGMFEVGCGTSPTREGMAENMILAPTEVKSKRPTQVTHTVQFTPETSGSYYFGIHGITPKSHYDDLYVYSIGLTDKTVDTAVTEVSTEGEAEYYDISGRRLTREQARGLVIVRRGGKVSKMIIR